MTRFHRFAVLGGLLGLLSFSALSAPQPAVVEVQVLAFNDFHGNLEPPSGLNGRVGKTEAGGLEYLGTQLARLKATNPNTLVVSAGDNIGATPLLSSMFHDEPSIEGLNDAGLQVSAVGNHELDKGWWELLRMVKGGCHPVDGCQDGTPFNGATFQFLSANMRLDPRRVDPGLLAKSGWTRGGRTKLPAALFPSYAVKTVGGVRVGIIGLTLQTAPQIVPPASLVGITFMPEAQAANRAARALRRQGVRAVLVLIHEGGTPGGDDYDGCQDFSGPIVQIVRDMSDDIDVVVSGHTHQAYNCTIGRKLVTSAGSYGRLITDIGLRINRGTGRIVSKQAHNLIVTRDVARDASETTIIEHYRPLAATVGSRQVGSIAETIDREPTAAGETMLGGVVADAMLEAARKPANGGAVVALVNIGGIRSDLIRPPSLLAGTPAPVMYSDIFSTLPFGNITVVKTMSGDALGRLLERQFDNPGPGRRTILQVSRGFSYAYNPARPAGGRVDRASITIDGRPVGPTDQVRVAMVDFLWSGGDGFKGVAEGTESVSVGNAMEELIAYLGRHSPVSPSARDRIRQVEGP